MKRIILLIPILAILSLFTGCKTKTVLVPVEKVKIEYRDRLRVDSVYNRDTVNIYELADKGDFRRITRIVNGGLTGWNSRLTFYNRAKEVLK
jgi:predicted chitinase